jgi:methane monooxygenase PmoA-like
VAYSFPRCQVVPLPDYQVSFELDGVERLRWHYGPSYPRPFFYPLVGPSGSTLTRMGHPGAPDHDHHRSIWFAHNKVLGIDFWSDRTEARIRQKEWLCYQDGDDEAVMAVLLHWVDGHDPRELLAQEVVAAVRPGPEGETFVELQSTFRPQADSLEFQKTNFGFLAVRVAKSISAAFGGGQLTNSQKAQGEPAIFAHPARWVDYSGPVPGGQQEGITYFDHPSNPGYPTSWHVREDGWMGAAPCLSGPLVTRRDQPLVLRYLLHAHRGQPVRADEIASAFSATSGYEIVKSKIRHQQREIRRIAAAKASAP